MANVKRDLPAVGLAAGVAAAVTVLTTLRRRSGEAARRSPADTT